MEATFIDAKSEIQGKLTGRDARILGRFRGEIELTGRLETGEGSRVEARVRAEIVEIGGELSGEIQARRLTLLEKARVDGKIRSEGLCVREGAQLDGVVEATGLVPDSTDKLSRPLPPPSVKGVTGG
jgi:cytoskeletal protein CcmA (bactofilin family)